MMFSETNRAISSLLVLPEASTCCAASERSFGADSSSAMLSGVAKIQVLPELHVPDWRERCVRLRKGRALGDLGVSHRDSTAQPEQRRG